jgi:hypothetical protein
MNDGIAPKRSSLRPKLVEATMFLKSSMSLIPINLVDVVESLIWNTLIPFSLELVDNIDDPNDNENEQDDDEEQDDDDNDDDDDLLPMPVEIEEVD